MPSEVRFAVLRKLYESNGWKLDRISGSHHIFRAPSGATESVPVHGGKVLPIYVRKAERAIAQERERGG